MPEHKFKSIKPAARHMPEVSIEKDTSGNNVAVELPGKVQFGFDVDGVFVPLTERKAPGLFADIERAKQSDE